MLNQYVVARIRVKEGSRLVFGKVHEIAKGVAYISGAKDSHIPQLKTSYEAPVKDVVAILGDNPAAGKVYGFDASHCLKGKVPHDFFGDICFFYKPSKEVKAKLVQAFDEAATIFKKAGFDFPDHGVWEIYSPEVSGKWAGHYKHSKNPEKNPHRFAISPEKMGASDYTYVILHELAHYVEFSFLRNSPKLQAAWIRLYNTSIKPQTIKKDVSQHLLDILLAGEDRPSDLRGQLEEEHKNAFNWIVRQIKADHNVSLYELDILFEAQCKDEIKTLWPLRSLAKKELAPIVSEYATTNVRELFAESAAFYWTKKKLPQNVHSLFEKTLSYARTQVGKD
jgi:hypothetical protein